jgi:hypothetical protein
MPEGNPTSTKDADFLFLVWEGRGGDTHPKRGNSRHRKGVEREGD